jgi:F-type H+-transporting ATPase subunit delta
MSQSMVYCARFGGKKRNAFVINRSIARRYARALMDLTQADPQPIADRLVEFGNLLEQNPSLREVLQSPAFHEKERMRVLKMIIEKLAIKPPLDRFLELLAERRRINQIEGIIEIFAEYVDEQKNRVRVIVESATALDAQAKKGLRDTLNKALGREVLMELRVNPQLIGGMSVRMGSLVVDGSVQAGLRRLRETLLIHRT